MHQTLKKIFGARAAAVIAASKSLADVSHSGLKGQLRELLIADFFRPLLPPTIGVGHGEIVDSIGGTSSQQDIVIYDRALIPPALIGDSGVFPIDTVLYAFEIKSKLTLSELKESDANAKRLLRLGLIRGIRVSRLIIPGLIAFDTDLKDNGSSELDRYLKLIEDEGKKGIFGLRMLCVAKRGYWFLEVRGVNDSAWTEGELSKTRCHGFELLDVVSSVLKGYQKQGIGRVADLNSYLIDTGASVGSHEGLGEESNQLITGPRTKTSIAGGPSAPNAAALS